MSAFDTIHVGTFVKTPAPQIIEILGATSLDFAVLDAEHAPFDRAALDIALLAGRAARLPLLVRIPDHAAATILSTLDLGAAGLLVPHVDDAEQARDVVARARYRGGLRGYSGSPRSAGYGGRPMAEVIAEGDAVRIICQIESPQAVDSVARIVGTPGVDGVFVGRADLALSMGLDDPGAARVSQAAEHVIRAGIAAGKIIGMFVNSVAEREQYASLGVRWFVHGSDQSLLRQAAQAAASADDRSASVRVSR